jgi:hypothetical protein
MVSPAYYAFETGSVVAKRHIFQLYMAGRLSVGVLEKPDITRIYLCGDGMPHHTMFMKPSFSSCA